MAEASGEWDMPLALCPVVDLYVRNLQRRLVRLEAAVEAGDDDECLFAEIRHTRQTIKRHQVALVECGEDPVPPSLRTAAPGRVQSVAGNPNERLVFAGAAVQTTRYRGNIFERLLHFA